MQKGFGLVIFIIVITLLLLVGGGGFWLGRMSSTSNSSVITPALLNQNQSPQQTTFAKRSYDPVKELYPGHPLPQELIAISDDKLIGFNCDGPYMQRSDGQYLWSLELDGENYLKPLSPDVSTQIVNVNNYLRTVGYKQSAAYLTYCVTEAGTPYLLAGQPMPGGGAGSDVYIMDLNHGVAGPLGGVIKSEPWLYFGCSGIMQISQEAVYVFCSAGDGGFSAQAVYKKSLSSPEVVPVIKCRDLLSEDMQTSQVTCE